MYVLSKEEYGKALPFFESLQVYRQAVLLVIGGGLSWQDIR